MTTSLSPRSPVAPVHPTRQHLDELDALLQRMLELPVKTSEEAPTDAGASAPRPQQSETNRLEPRVLPMPVRHDAHPPLGSTDEEGEAWVPLRSSWQPSAQTWGPLAKQWQEAQQAGQSAPQEHSENSVPPAHEERPVEEASPAADPTAAAQILALPIGRGSEARDRGKSQQDTAESVERPARHALPTSWQVDAHANEQLEPLPSLKALLPPLFSAPSAPRPVESSPPADEPPLSPLLWPLVAINATFDCCLLLLGPFGNPLRSRGGKSFLGVVGILCLLGTAALAAIDWFGWTW